jgi:pentatricopeptide repeat protein
MKMHNTGVKKSYKPTRGKAPGGRVYEVAQAILNAPAGGVAAVIRDALNDKEAPIRRDPRAFTMFSTRCRKSGEWEKCVEIFDAMRDQGVETNTIVYNATMSACSKGGAWERALELFDDMPGLGHERSNITYNVAMGACMRGGDWERALELFDAMPGEGLERDAVSVNTAMAAAEAGGDQDRLRALAGGGAAAKGVKTEEKRSKPTSAAQKEDVDAEEEKKGESEDDDSSDDSSDDEDDDDKSDSQDKRVPRDGPKLAKKPVVPRSPSPPPAEEDPATRERHLKAERRDARRERFEEKRRARKAAKNARPWTSDDAGPSVSKKPKTKAATPGEATAKRKEWGGNPLAWVDEDEGVKRRKKGKAVESSDDEDDPNDDGLPPITGPSVFEAEEAEATTLINTDDGKDDFWQF